MRFFVPYLHFKNAQTLHIYSPLHKWGLQIFTKLLFIPYFPNPIIYANQWNTDPISLTVKLPELFFTHFSSNF